jgi:hypothetical protein
LSPVVQAAAISGIATGLTALIALGGVLFNIRSNRKSDREERYLNLRREVYLDAARTYASAIQLLTGTLLPEGQPPEQIRQLSNDLGAAVGKIMIVGNERTIRAWSELQNTFLSIFAQLATVSMPYRETALAYMKIKGECEAADASDRSAAAFRTLMACGDLLKEQIRLVKTVADQCKKLQPLTTEATLAAKKELGIGVDEAQFRKLMEQASVELYDVLVRMSESINSRFQSVLTSLKSPEKCAPPQ